MSPMSLTFHRVRSTDQQWLNIMCLATNMFLYPCHLSEANWSGFQCLACVEHWCEVIWKNIHRIFLQNHVCSLTPQMVCQLFKVLPEKKGLSHHMSAVSWWMIITHTWNMLPFTEFKTDEKKVNCSRRMLSEKHERKRRMTSCSSTSTEWLSRGKSSQQRWWLLHFFIFFPRYHLAKPTVQHTHKSMHH